ncbi:hypothetical protein Cgig2_006356 [Carnegiea gigantea]|uniref:Uncharacterized protein n=1 Tax=Carnegiea gigantea TaxID=171969 RepID=A0A9Q1Q3S7_9CARY|nr:hypothetical protein Cgig2_006356 [Carnegiea gigantea]
MASTLSLGTLWIRNKDGAWFHAFFHIITNAYAPFVHKKAMEKKYEKDPDAYHWLRDNKKLGLWATCKFDTILKCDDNTISIMQCEVQRFVHLDHVEEIMKLIGSRFQLMLPYKDVARCIFNMKQQVRDYIKDCFTVKKYRNLYNHILLPILAPQMPPEYKRRETLYTPLPKSQMQQIPPKVMGFGTTRYNFHLI